MMLSIAPMDAARNEGTPPAAVNAHDTGDVVLACDPWQSQYERLDG